MAFYQPLDAARNEVRMLKIVDSPDGQHVHLVHCELETVSLDAYTPEFKRFCEKRGIPPMGLQYQTTRAWLRECSPTVHTLRRNEAAQSVIILPLWRVMEDSENSSGYGPGDPVPLDYLKDTIDAITSDSSRCPPMPSTSSSFLRDVSLYHGPIPGEDTYFPLVPRFEWGDFEALSYCWESDKLERHMILNKTLVGIPKNLEALLQRLKEIPEMKAGMKFWVDGLCIDQRNVDEKNSQVKLMKDIYSKAFAVLVWLGDAADDSDKAVDFCSASYLWFLGDEMAWQKWWRRHFKVDLPHHERIFSEMPWKELLSLFSRSYWSRLWIIQELVLNHNMSLFLCGKRQLSRKMIQRGCFLSTEDTEMIDRLIASKYGTGNNIPGIIMGSVWTTFSRVQTLTSMHGQETSMDRVLDLGRKAKLKDPKDRIYGLLGLLPPSIADQIHPDYDLSQRQVYTQFARSVLSKADGIDALLSWCAFEDDSIRPSWIPDWTTPFTRNHVQWLRKRQASGRVVAQWSISDDSQHLHVRGIIVDTVKSASRSRSEYLPYKSELRKSPQNHGRSFPLQHHHYGSRKNLSAALWRTLAQDHPNIRNHQVDRSILDIYWVDWSYIRETDPAHDQPSDVWHAMRNITSNSSWEGFDQFRQTNADFSIFGYPFRDFFPDIRRCTSPPLASETSLGLPTLRSHSEGMIEDNTLSKEVGEHMKLSMLTLFGRKLVTTANKYLGLAPEAVRVGDLIAIIFGCNFPVVLRQHGEFYSVIGECYIDGIMNGEIVEIKVSGEHRSTELVLC